MNQLVEMRFTSGQKTRYVSITWYGGRVKVILVIEQHQFGDGHASLLKKNYLLIQEFSEQPHLELSFHPVDRGA